MQDIGHQEVFFPLKFSHGLIKQMFKWSIISPKSMVSEKAPKLNQIRTKPFLSHQSSHDPSHLSDFPEH